MELQVEKRETLGKGVRSLRRRGQIPAELYGHGIQNFHLAVNSKDFEKLYKEAGENTVINVKVEGSMKPVLIHDVQFNPLTGEIGAVDFYEVRMDEEIRIPVPLEFVGASPAVSLLHGVLIKAMDEIEVEALPGDIPQEIKVDLAKLTELNQSLYVRDLVAAGNFRFTVDPETVVLTVSEPAPEEEAPAAEVKPEEVVVETEEKKLQRDALKAKGEAEE
ncbi:MAG: 50S ribosomal protein L25 [Candidatus Colwellbacteria bacterium]|nr:50S ribosomal protein L25 [Candidatus Colwellbacteria bacterium]